MWWCCVCDLLTPRGSVCVCVRLGGLGSGLGAGEDRRDMSPIAVQVR